MVRKVWDKAKVTERERVGVDTKAHGKAKTVGQKNGGEEIAGEDMCARRCAR